ncbi:hypothetical protein BH11BAC4_BH11BAC4_01760 [soil metagenome]
MKRNKRGRLGTGKLCTMDLQIRLLFFISIVCFQTSNAQTNPTICQGNSVTICLDSFYVSESFCNYPQIPINLKNGLIGYWPFCGNANDVSGAGNNGVVFGSSLTSDRFGNPNSAYYFNGINNYIKCPGGNNFTSQKLTISYWININNYNATSEIICLGNPLSTSWGTVSSNTGTGLSCGTGCGASSPPSTPSTFYTPNKWYNIVLVYDKLAQNSDIYVNGIFIGNNITSPTIGCQNSDIYFGVDIFSNPEYFTGKLDDIEMWNRLLSPSEIQEVYTQATKASWLNGANTNCITVSPLQTTYYYYTVNTGNQSYVDSIKVTVLNSVSTVVNKIICQGQSYIGYSTSGLFIDTLPAANGCDSIRTLNLTVLPISISTINTSICEGESFLGHTVSGTYIDTLTAFNGCDSLISTNLTVIKTCAVYFPSAFTPNNDSKNDVFKILNAHNLLEYNLTIYNRWGQKVFETKDYTAGWDGIYNKVPQPIGVYVWYSTFNLAGKNRQMKGTVVLIR